VSPRSRHRRPSSSACSNACVRLAPASASCSSSGGLQRLRGPLVRVVQQHWLHACCERARMHSCRTTRLVAAAAVACRLLQAHRRPVWAAGEVPAGAQRALSVCFWCLGSDATGAAVCTVQAAPLRRLSCSRQSPPCTRGCASHTDARNAACCCACLCVCRTAHGCARRAMHPGCSRQWRARCRCALFL
jgi:hypothetical protein